MKSIAVFNNKGGVGKTTLLCNLASYLAMNEGYKVLVIDADPQCNSTQSMFQDEEVYSFYEKRGVFTLYTVVHPLATGRGFAKDFSPHFSEGFGVHVIPGNPKLSLEEDVLAQDWMQARAGDERGLRTTFLFAQLLERCSEYDYVFFDMGPSLGSINRSVLIAADFFLTPMSIDIFSLRAIDNISQSLREWRTHLENGLELHGEPEEIGIETPEWKLRFLGFVTQQYTGRRMEDGEWRPVKAFERIMRQIPLKIQAKLIERLERNETPASDYELGAIPNFHSLIPLSQSARKPVFRLKGGDGVVGAHFAKVRAFEEVIGSIAENFQRNVEELS